MRNKTINFGVVIFIVLFLVASMVILFSDSSTGSEDTVSDTVSSTEVCPSPSDGSTTLTTESVVSSGEILMQEVTENLIEATCAEDGSYEAVVYDFTGAEISRETVVIPATGHSFEEGVCTVCGEDKPKNSFDTLPWKNTLKWVIFSIGILVVLFGVIAFAMFLSEDDLALAIFWGVVPFIVGVFVVVASLTPLLRWAVFSIGVFLTLFALIFICMAWEEGSIGGLIAVSIVFVLGVFAVVISFGSLKWAILLSSVALIITDILFFIYMIVEEDAFDDASVAIPTVLAFLLVCVISIFTITITINHFITDSQSPDIISSTDTSSSLMQTTTENKVEATCTEDGSYDLVVYDSTGVEISRETVVIPATGHSYQEVSIPATCTNNGYLTYTCTHCNGSYSEPSSPATGHNYVEGICSVCYYKDPDYVKIYSSKEIMNILSSSIVTDSGTLRTHINGETISVFAKDRTDCFSMNTAVSYNLWGGNVQEVVFNISDLSNKFPTLYFYVGGETGTKGVMVVEFFLDKTFEETPDYTFSFECSDIPDLHSLKIDGKTSMSIRVTNTSGNVNRVVFFDFSSAS